MIDDSAQGRYAQLEAALTVLRADAADPDAWAKFYAFVAPRVRAQLYILGEHRRDRLDDLTHEVLLRFLRYSPWPEDWRQLPPAATVLAYLRKIAFSVFVDDRSEPQAQAQVPLGERDTAVVENQTADIEDMEVTLQRMREHLTPEDRLLLKLVIEGRSIQDVGELLGISYSAAGVRIHRLRQKMQHLSGSL